MTKQDNSKPQGNVGFPDIGANLFMPYGGSQWYYGMSQRLGTLDENFNKIQGKHQFGILLLNTGTLIPKGSRLTLTLASSSTAEDPGNLLYLDLPMPGSAKVTFGPALLTLPVLRTPISR